VVTARYGEATEVAVVHVTVQQTSNGHIVVNLAGELDIATAPQVIGAVRSALADGPVDELIIDVDRLEFVDSTGVHALVQAREAARARGASFALRRPCPLVARVLDVSGVSDFLGVSASGR
jgi:anti-anti-sigma factor